MFASKLQKTKGQFNSVIEHCQNERPEVLLQDEAQIQDKVQTAILSKDTYECLMSTQSPTLEFLFDSPLKDLELKFPTNKTLPPNPDLEVFTVDCDF